ncbi:MAG: DUF5711 family protein [Oscillospiraceae bacterium]|jgi:hypothetical protein|nr:DUF5711 family protein [Oscillospiraceae bacterium]
MTKPKKKKVAARIISLVLILLVITALALMLFVGGELSVDGARKALSSFKKREAASEFFFEQGVDRVFASVGDSIVAAGDVGLQVIGVDGEVLHRDIVRLGTPAIARSGGIAAVYDIGGTSLRIVDKDGALAKLESETPIVSCSVGAGGYVALVTDEGGGYISGVKVFGGRNYSGKYRWRTADGYVIAAAVSNDNKSVAILTAQNGGSIIHFFSLDSETERAQCVFDGELLLDIAYGGDGNVVAIGRSGVYTVNSRSANRSVVYDYAGSVLGGFSLGGDGYVPLLLRDGKAARLVTVDLGATNGAVLADIPAEGDLLWLDAYGDRIAVLWEARLVGYDKRLAERGTRENALGLSSVLLRRNGKALAIGAHNASVFEID